MSKQTNKTHVNIGIKCFICGQTYGQKVMDMHMHSYFHHEAIEKIKGSEQLHKCWACDVSVMGLEQYKEHITIDRHRHNLSKLREKRQKRKPLNVDYNIDLTEDELQALYDLRQQKQCPKDLNKCTICLHRFPAQEWDKHMHSISHHLSVEQLKGSEHEHKCWACDMTKTGLAEFKKHISTKYHKMKLSELVKNRELGNNTVDYSVEFDELKDLCAQRDREKYLKKKEKIEKWKETKRQKTMRFVQTQLSAVNNYWHTPFTGNEEFEAEQLPPSYHFMPFWENQNDHPGSTQHNQNLPPERQEGIHDMDRLNGPPVKRPCLERPSEYIPHKMSAHGTRSNPDGKSTDVCVNDMTPETEDGSAAAAERTCAPGLVQSMMEANIPNLTAAKGVCTAAGNEAVVLNPPLHTDSKKPMLKVNTTAPQSEPVMTSQWDSHKPPFLPQKYLQLCSEDELNFYGFGTTWGDCMSGQEPNADSLPPVSVLAEMFPSQATENELETVENIRPQTARVQKNKSNECETEQGETSQKHHSSLKTISCKAQKTKKKTKKQDGSRDLNSETNNKISRKRKVNKLMSLSLKEEELTGSLENVGEELFQAYSTLQNAYTEVQRLLAVKQEVTSEMSSLRAKRIKILQDMKNPDDQQEVLNES